MRWLVCVAAAALVGSTIVAATQRSGLEGPAWQDTGPAGHDALARQLATTSRVRVLESSVALIAPGAGENDALILFPTDRAPSKPETAAVRSFAEHGGTVIVVADGGQAQAWLQPLGAALHGLPLVLHPGFAPGACLPAWFNLTAGNATACLPSPTILPASNGSYVPIARLAVEVAVDLDGDQNLGMGDQSAQRYPVAVQQSSGRGQVILVSDADLWRNDILGTAPENLAVATLLVGAAQTVYLDSTGDPRPGLQGVGPGLTKASGELRSTVGAAWALSIAATAAALAVQPRHRPWTRHQSHAVAVPDHLRSESIQILAANEDGHEPNNRVTE